MKTFTSAAMTGVFLLGLAGCASMDRDEGLFGLEEGEQVLGLEQDTAGAIGGAAVGGLTGTVLGGPAATLLGAGAGAYAGQELVEEE